MPSIFFLFCYSISFVERVENWKTFNAKLKRNFNDEYFILFEVSMRHRKNVLSQLCNGFGCYVAVYTPAPRKSAMIKSKMKKIVLALPHCHTPLRLYCVPTCTNISGFSYYIFFDAPLWLYTYLCCRRQKSCKKRTNVQCTTAFLWCDGQGKWRKRLRRRQRAAAAVVVTVTQEFSTSLSLSLSHFRPE